MKNNLHLLDQQDALSLLRWYVDSGVTETIGDHPLDWFALSIPPDIPASRPDQNEQKPAAAPPSQGAERRRETPGAVMSVEQNRKKAEAAAAACTTLAELEQAIRDFDGCNLKKTATHTVFGDGNPDRRIMVIGEAPGVNEDRQGVPFVGAAGKLLDKMLAAIDLDRKTDFYITNILPWRPPGNRSPTPEEITICLPFVLRHIELCKPELLILLGGVAATTLLDSTASITRLRGKWHSYKVEDRTIPARALYHPAYLLKQPRHKGDTWRDLLDIKSKITELSL